MRLQVWEGCDVTFSFVGRAASPWVFCETQGVGEVDLKPIQHLPSLKLTASLHLKMDGWKTILSF